MRKRLLMILAMLMAAVFVFGACGGGSSGLVGRWGQDRVELEFRNDGSGTLIATASGAPFRFSWTESDGDITFFWYMYESSLAISDYEEVTSYSISADGSELHIHGRMFGQRFTRPFMRVGSN